MSLLMKKYKFSIIIAACIAAFVACTTDSESDELLEVRSVSECIPDTEDLSGFDDNAVSFELIEGDSVLRFPALWNAATETPQLRSSRSGDTLVVDLYSDEKAVPGTNCAVWVEANVHGGFDASFLRVNAQTFKLVP